MWRGRPPALPGPVRYGTSTDAWRPVEDDDDDNVPAAGARADNGEAGTFVYVNGAVHPDDVVRLVVDPSIVVIPPTACEGRTKLTEMMLRHIQTTKDFIY
jgi:hypothetical protein